MILKFLMIPAAILLGFAIIPPAQADRNPQPPPSGIVIHLFGQNSVLSNILPTTAAPSAGTTSTSAPTNAPANAPTNAPSNAPSNAPANAPKYVEPTTGEIIHQMFVTGDPNNPSKPAPGRVADRP